jgi:hypothetical protein
VATETKNAGRAAPAAAGRWVRRVRNAGVSFDVGGDLDGRQGQPVWLGVVAVDRGEQCPDVGDGAPVPGANGLVL